MKITEEIIACRQMIMTAFFVTPLISPGFIDLHTHVDRGMTFLENRACLNYLHQGVTSVVVGQCGSSGWPYI